MTSFTIMTIKPNYDTALFVVDITNFFKDGVDRAGSGDNTDLPWPQLEIEVKDLNWQLDADANITAMSFQQRGLIDGTPVASVESLALVATVELQLRGFNADYNIVLELLTGYLLAKTGETIQRMTNESI